MYGHSVNCSFVGQKNNSRSCRAFQESGITCIHQMPWLYYNEPESDQTRYRTAQRFAPSGLQMVNALVVTVQIANGAFITSTTVSFLRLVVRRPFMQLGMADTSPTPL